MKEGNKRTSSQMLKIVRERGHFEIRMIPSFSSRLSFSDLEDIIKKNQIKYRGLFYPHIANHGFGKFQRVSNYIESFHQWGDSAEIWRLYKSGQFKHFRGFVEDRWNSNPRPGILWQPEMEVATPESTFFEPIVKIWELTEMFLFASKLANGLKRELTIEITLHKMEDRQLQIRTGGRFGFIDDYTCHTETIELEPVSASVETLQIKHKEFARDKLLEIFDYFGWNDQYISVTIQKEQARFYS